jgi:hypothetical protein
VVPLAKVKWRWRWKCPGPVTQEFLPEVGKLQRDRLIQTSLMPQASLAISSQVNHTSA